MTLIALAVLLPVVAIGLYAGKQAKTVEQLSQLGPGGQPDPFKMVARLEKRLESAPDDPAGWARLGRSYAVLERFDDAKRAYAKATQLAPDDVAILTDYATLLISENPRQPSKEALAAFTRLYQLNPKHPGALWVLGLDAYNNNKYKQAIKHWEALLGRRSGAKLVRTKATDAEVGPGLCVLVGSIGLVFHLGDAKCDGTAWVGKLVRLGRVRWIPNEVEAFDIFTFPRKPNGLLGALHELVQGSGGTVVSFRR